MAIVPARLAFADDGTPYSEAFGDVYHAAAGGLAQARHVFLGGNDLPRRWARRTGFVVLETGFGLGLNFLATWAAWREDPERPQRLHFLSVEKHPFAAPELARALERYPEVASLAAELGAQWPELTPGFHRLEFAGGRVVLTLAFGDAIAALPQFVAEADAVFLDGFSPARNPELWSPGLLREIALACAPGATLATWSVAAAVREAVAGAGFAVEKRRGFATKHEMLVARLDGERRGDGSTGRRRAAVVGAGLAGCLVAERLAARGLEVELFERQPGPAQETSGNLTAAMLPVLSLDDARLSRVNRAACLHAQRLMRAWRAEGLAIDGDDCGVLQIARDPAHEAKQREIVERNALPPGFVRFVERDEAAALAGMDVAGAGWWFAGGGWANPESLCRAALRRAGERLATRFATAVADVVPEGGDWRLLDAEGRTLAQADTVVLAGATELATLPVSAHLPLFRFRGQVSHLPAGPLARLRCVVCREGYATPAHAGFNSVGASFQRGGEAAPSLADHCANLDRLERMLPGTSNFFAADELGGRVGFRPVSPDKQPIVGDLYPAGVVPQGRDLSAIPRLAGLHVATGYGARGLVWAPLMAELLASRIAGDPLPLESDLAGSVDPARLTRRSAI